MKTYSQSIVASAVLVLNFVALAHAGVSISSTSQPTPGLAGFKTYTLTASSDIGGEFISVVDFIGDKDNTNPETARGFFGPMNQLEAGGPGTTVFNNFNFIFPNPQQDSQFKESSSNVIVAALSESTTSLRAGYAYASPSALSLAFAQLTISDAAIGGVNYRGVFSVLRGGTIVDLPELTGCMGACIYTPPSVADELRQTHTLGAVIDITLFDSAPGAPPVTWSALSGPTYTPRFGLSPNAPGLGPATWSWNPQTQEFQFKTLGASPGTYVWSGAASGPGGSDPFLITALVNIPEPASLVLVGLVGVGFSLVRARCSWARRG